MEHTFLNIDKTAKKVVGQSAATLFQAQTPLFLHSATEHV